MLFALINGIKESPIPKNNGICPLCEKVVISKCGKFKTWHWAHKSVDLCDDWNKPETEWHRKWKKVFGINNCEIILIKDGKKHIADIQTIHGNIIELQNSPINLETIQAREEFYGNEMIWIINGVNFIKDFIVRPFQGTEYDDYSPEFEIYAKLNGFSTNYKIFNEENIESFKWKRPKEVWGYAKAKVYIDFGNEFLFHVKDGLGFSKGVGENISKRNFISNHGGDESLTYTLINVE